MGRYCRDASLKRELNTYPDICKDQKMTSLCLAFLKNCFLSAILSLLSYTSLCLKQHLKKAKFKF